MEILLSKIMHERNLTVRQVEQMTKVPKSTINDIMNGKSPRLDTLEQLAAGLKVKISDLYDSPYKLVSEISDKFKKCVTSPVLDC